MATLRCAALLAALIAAAPAAAQPKVLPGPYAGQWVNLTFLSKGSINATATINGNTLSIVMDAGGNVFGQSNPGPTTFTGTLTAQGWTASVDNDPAYGDCTVTITTGGAVTVTGTNVPGGVIENYSATGTYSLGKIHLDGTVNFFVGDPATTVINVFFFGTTTIASPNQIKEGYLGYAVSGVPDANGDGRADVIVGAPAESPNGVDEGGRAYLYSGANGTLLRTFISPGNEIEGHFGVSVAGIPDVNGDGRGDVVIGATEEDPGNSPEDVGRAYIFSGSNGALLFKLLPPTPQVNQHFGISVAGCADLNNDGRGDVIVGAADEDIGPVNGAGRVHVYSGKTGLRIRSLQAPAPANSDIFGEWVAAVPDVNGDGRPDILVGMPQSATDNLSGKPGKAFLFNGANGTLLRTFNSPGAEANGFFGVSVSGIPDVNADGRGDILIGAPGEDPGASPTDCGRAYIYSGMTGGLLFKLLPPTPTLGGFFGNSVSGVLDISGDAKGDVIIGAPFEGAGRVYTFNGATGAKIQTILPVNGEAGGAFGTVAGTPDLNTNGKGDIVVGASQEDPGNAPQSAGRAYIFRK